MIHGYIKSNHYESPLPINIEYPNKLSNILIDIVTHITVGFDSIEKTFKLFNSYTNGEEFELTLTEDVPIDVVKILDKRVYNNDKETGLNPVFEYLYMNDKNEVKTYKIDIIGSIDAIIKLEIVSMTKYEFETYDDSLNNIIKSILINDKRYIYLYDYSKNILNIIEYNTDTSYQFDLSNEIHINKNYIQYLYFNKDNDISINKVPVFCSRYNLMDSVLFFIDMENSIIKRKVVFETYKISNNILKVYLKNNKDFYDLKIFTRYNGAISELSFILSNSFTDKDSNILDSKFVIDSGLEKNPDNKLNVHIKSYQPSYHEYNKPRFQVKAVKTDIKSSITKNENQSVDIQSTDNLKRANEESYNNEDIINKTVIDRNEVEKIIDFQLQHVEYLTDLDHLEQDTDEFDVNLNKENQFIQEFTSEGVKTFASINTDPNSRNIIEISSSKINKQTNIPIEVEKLATKVTNESVGESGFEIKQINSLAINVNEFNEVIFPFLNIAFRKFGNFVYQKEDVDILYPLYNDYVVLSRRNKLIASNYNSYNLGNSKINEIINFVYAKFRENEANYVSKDQIARFITDTFKSVKESDKIYLNNETETLDLYKYINKYNGYRLNQ